MVILLYAERSSRVFDGQEIRNGKHYSDNLWFWIKFTLLQYHYTYNKKRQQCLWDKDI